MNKVLFVLSLLANLSNVEIHCELQTEQRPVDDFDKIYVKGPGKLIVKQGKESCSIEADKKDLLEIKSVPAFNVLYLLNNSNQEAVTFSVSLKDILTIETPETLSLEINNFVIKNPLLIRISSLSEASYKLVLNETPIAENASITHNRNALNIQVLDTTKPVIIKKLIVTTEKIEAQPTLEKNLK